MSLHPGTGKGREGGKLSSPPTIYNMTGRAIKRMQLAKKIACFGGGWGYGMQEFLNLCRNLAL